MKTLTLEIRAAEGGEDSKLFVGELANAYQRYFSKVGWKHRVVYIRPGEIAFHVTGSDIDKLKSECGGHRIQRVPTTERKGRVHTSTVTVAVLEEENKTYDVLTSDLKIEWFSGTGKGGQHRNKHQNSCRIIHLPTGIVCTAQCRSRNASYREAFQALSEKLKWSFFAKQEAKEASVRKQQVGSGMRGDKIRTYRFQDNTVTDHNTGKTARASDIMKGNFDLLV